jgi:squalene-hopene/tetraprenyl-beta-curcumene cyclase
MITLLLTLSLCGDWSPRLAADYLDGRQKEWFAWKTAQTAGGPCVSCHTGVTYLLARPELRRKLGEHEPTSYETGLLRTLHSAGFGGSFAKEPRATDAAGVQSIHSALLVGDEAALDHMWSLQLTEGKDKGAWNWFHLNVDPYELTESAYYGATLAALATSRAPADHRARHREQIAMLTDYLRRQYVAQPLHHRLMLLWAMPEALPDKKALIDEISKVQQPDGGWSIESLGPWKTPSRTSGSDAYATGFVTYVLLNDHNRSNKGLDSALNWLKSHQNREYGFWPSTSMNKEYPADSMMVKFMQDAATGFAALALLESER